MKLEFLFSIILAIYLLSGFVISKTLVRLKMRVAFVSFVALFFLVGAYMPVYFGIFGVEVFKIIFAGFSSFYCWVLAIFLLALAFLAVAETIFDFGKTPHPKLPKKSQVGYSLCSTAMDLPALKVYLILCRLLN